MVTSKIVTSNLTSKKYKIEGRRHLTGYVVEKGNRQILKKQIPEIIERRKPDK